MLSKQSTYKESNTKHPKNFTKRLREQRFAGSLAQNPNLCKEYIFATSFAKKNIERQRRRQRQRQREREEKTEVVLKLFAKVFEFD